MNPAADRVTGARSGGSRAAGAAYLVLLTICSLLALVWLILGAAVAVAAHSTSVAAELSAAAAAGNLWAGGVVGAIPRTEPIPQVLVDYAFSTLNVIIAALLLASRRSGWPGRLLALALVGSAGAFNLQAQAAATAVRVATGFSVGGVQQVLLHGVACAGYVAALMIFPERGVSSRNRGAILAVGAGTLVLVGTGTALLAHTLTSVIFFGVGVPIVGLALLPGRIRRASTVAQRTQARLLFSVLMAALVVAIVLTIITALLTSLGSTGLTLVDPTTPTGLLKKAGGGQPVALLFWYSRLSCFAIAAAVLVATRPGALWTAERRFSRSLVALLVSALVGGGYFVLDTVVEVALGPGRDGAGIAVTVLATGTAALAFLPVYRYSERLIDRVLYGTRPTPYSVLADITALSTSSAADAPDLERVAEAVGRGLSATTCRLTVIRPGLRDRTYTWAKRMAHASDELIEVPIRHGDVRIGAIAVDHAAVAGLLVRRQRLLEDIADSLGAVLQASRLGIELERQLRAALAHAAEIARARRAAVAEMDGERRRIERNLHDGAQHHLVSLRLTLGLVEHQVSTAQLEQARDRLDQVVEKIAMAESVLAETAAGVSSPLLAQRGLVGALGTELAAGHPPVVLDAAGVATGRRFPAEVEAAVYFCCLEAVNNARKHAPGAAIEVRLSVSGGRLHLCVRDHGPGWDTAAVPGSPGHGMRNVAARIGAVGGRVRVRSAPGAGTTVEGSVPVPDWAVPTQRLPSGGRGRRPATVAVRGTAGAELLDRLRHAAQVAGDLYQGTRHAESLRLLRDALDGPLRIAVVGPPGTGISTLVDALQRHAASATRATGAPWTTAVRLVDAAAAVPRQSVRFPEGAEADAVLLLLRLHGPEGPPRLVAPGPQRDRGPRTIGVLNRADDAVGRALRDPAAAERAAAYRRSLPDVRSLCPVVVPVTALLARAAATPREADHRELTRLGTLSDDQLARLVASPNGALRVVPSPRPRPRPAGRPVPMTGVLDDAGVGLRELLDRYGPVGVALSVDLIRSGQAPTAAELATAQLAWSGLPRLHQLVEARFVRCADALKARSALRALDGIVRAEPPGGGAQPLVYLLERIRSGAHEFAEMDLVDALQAGERELPEPDRAAAERLLGGSGTDPRIRLCLPPDADPHDLTRAAAEQLSRWQRQARHPAATADARAVGSVLVRTCEQLLARAAATEAERGASAQPSEQEVPLRHR